MALLLFGENLPLIRLSLQVKNIKPNLIHIHGKPIIYATKSRKEPSLQRVSETTPEITLVNLGRLDALIHLHALLGAYSVFSYPFVALSACTPCILGL